MSGDDPFEMLTRGAQYGRPQAEKNTLLLPALKNLTQRHRDACPAYARILDVLFPAWEAADDAAGLPYVPARLFKTHDLRSVPESEVRVMLTSSGTGGQAVSRIALDDATARRQARALGAAMREALGGTRLPMLLIESEAVLADRTQMSARGAGAIGMMQFGCDHCFVLDADMQLRVGALKDFLTRHGGAPFLIFGFTFMIWQYFHAALDGMGFDLGRGVLIHSGGWKKLQDRAVDNAAFREALGRSCGLTNIYNFYGMAEQIGSAFLEGPDGLLYPPAFADVLIRDPRSGAILPPGEAGLIEVMSLAPLSYPGHAILTEDMGVIDSVDSGAGGRLGRGLRIVGRAPRAEIRGCGDTHAAGQAV